MMTLICAGLLQFCHINIPNSGNIIFYLNPNRSIYRNIETCLRTILFKHMVENAILRVYSRGKNNTCGQEGHIARDC